MIRDSETVVVNNPGANKHREALIHLVERDVLLCQEKQRQISGEDWSLLADPLLCDFDVNTLLARYHLLSSAELSALDDFLSHLAVGDHALFTGMCFNEKLESYLRLGWAIKTYKISHKISRDLMQEAAVFALQQAKSVPDFAARYQFYVCCIKKLQLETFAPSIRAARIRLIQDAISVNLNISLPGVSGLVSPPSPQGIPKLLNDGFVEGRHLGFTDVAIGLWLTAQYLPLLAMSYAEISRATKDFVRHVHVFFKHHQATDVQLVQTGEYWVYEFNYPEVQARLRLSASGCLTLDFYRLVCTDLLRARLPQEDRVFF